MTTESRSIVNVSQMARMVGLSRQRFWQLACEGVFLLPVYDIKTKRPLYVSEMQETNLRVRQTNFGLNNRPIMFYAKRTTPVRSGTAEPSRKGSVCPKSTQRHESIIEGLKQLGMPTVTSAQVDAAIKALYPNGQTGDDGDVLRTIFVHLMRRDS